MIEKQRLFAKCLKLTILFGVMIIIFGSVSFVWAGSPGTYHGQALEIMDKIGAILIHHGLCSDQNDCQKKELRFFGRTSTGVEVETYQISDASIIKEIIAACVDLYDQNQKKITVTLYMYRQPHEEMLGLAKLYKNPFIKLQLIGEEK